MREGEMLNVILDCEECVKDFGSVSVWKCKNGKYVVAILDERARIFKVYSIENNVEFAINNAFWLNNVL